VIFVWTVHFAVPLKICHVLAKRYDSENKVVCRWIPVKLYQLEIAKD